MCVHCNICHQYAVSFTSVDHYYIHVVSYNMSLIHYIADMPTRGQLRSLSSGHLDVRQSCLVTVGDRSFVTAAPRFWNSLPSDIQSVSSLTTFLRKLKAHLFQQLYPDIILVNGYLSLLLATMVLQVSYLGHSK